MPRLDATLCFVGGSVPSPGNGVGPDSSEVEVGSEEDDDEDGDDDEDEEDAGEQDAWASGDVGGFECYVEADGSGDSAEAAEVYKGPGAEGDDEPELLSLSPGPNVLSLVMRDAEVMRFVKYVSAAAPGSRWDVTLEYEIEPVDEEDEGEDDET